MEHRKILRYVRHEQHLVLVAAFWSEACSFFPEARNRANQYALNADNDII